MAMLLRVLSKPSVAWFLTGFGVGIWLTVFLGNAF